VVLAIPGSQQPEKGYLEPGGSFSPGVRTFGISIWVRSPDGKLKTTSDAVPLEQVRQRFCWPDPHGVPAVATDTPWYTATWSRRSTGIAELELEHRGDPAERLELAWIFLA
jgi:hypothetical protein